VSTIIKAAQSSWRFHQCAAFATNRTRIGTWRQERTTALMAAGSKKAAGKVPVTSSDGGVE